MNAAVSARSASEAAGSPRLRRQEMPRENMVSLIQKIARQARLTFPASTLGATGGTKSFADNLSQLNNLVNKLRAEDLKIAPRAQATGAESVKGIGPPVTYMHICETPGFSMGVFLLQSGQAYMPLHDHPGMHGMLKVLYGTLSIRSYDRIAEPAPVPPAFSPPLPESVRREALRRVLRRNAGLFGPDSPPCLLSPHKDNLHQIAAMDGPAAFLDILAPPYDPDYGRDCHYYQVLQPEAGEEAAMEDDTGPREVWLLEIPQPADFWCGAESYPGPKVTL